MNTATKKLADVLLVVQPNAKCKARRIGDDKEYWDCGRCNRTWGATNPSACPYDHTVMP